MMLLFLCVPFNVVMIKKETCTSVAAFSVIEKEIESKKNEIRTHTSKEMTKK